MTALCLLCILTGWLWLSLSLALRLSPLKLRSPPLRHTQAVATAEARCPAWLGPCEQFEQYTLVSAIAGIGYSASAFQLGSCKQCQQCTLVSAMLCLLCILSSSAWILQALSTVHVSQCYALPALHLEQLGRDSASSSISAHLVSNMLCLLWILSRLAWTQQAVSTLHMSQ